MIIYRTIIIRLFRSALQNRELRHFSDATSDIHRYHYVQSLAFFESKRKTPTFVICGTVNPKLWPSTEIVLLSILLPIFFELCPAWQIEVRPALRAPIARMFIMGKQPQKTKQDKTGAVRFPLVLFDLIRPGSRATLKQLPKTGQFVLETKWLCLIVVIVDK